MCRTSLIRFPNWQAHCWIHLFFHEIPLAPGADKGWTVLQPGTRFDGITRCVSAQFLFAPDASMRESFQHLENGTALPQHNLLGLTRVGTCFKSIMNRLAQLWWYPYIPKRSSKRSCIHLSSLTTPAHRRELAGSPPWKGFHLRTKPIVFSLFSTFSRKLTNSSICRCYSTTWGQHAGAVPVTRLPTRVVGVSSRTRPQTPRKLPSARLAPRAAFWG